MLPMPLHLIMLFINEGSKCNIQCLIILQLWVIHFQNDQNQSNSGVDEKSEEIVLWKDDINWDIW